MPKRANPQTFIIQNLWNSNPKFPITKLEKMPSIFSKSQSQLISKQKCFLIFIFLVSLPLLFFVLSIKYKHQIVDVKVNTKLPPWFEVIAQGLNTKRKIKIGLVNINPKDGKVYGQLDPLHSQVDVVHVNFDHVGENLKWKDFFPEWIDESGKDQPKCPNISMLTLENYKDLNVVMAMLPCGEGMKEKGIRDVLRLQINLVVANLVMENGWMEKLDSDYRDVYVVFVGSCSPMVEIFKCEELLMHQGDYWVYKPNLKRLKQKTLMPVGSCQISPGFAETGKELWRGFLPQLPDPNHNKTMQKKQEVPKLAYVTVLHSSEAYVCGAIALAQSILLTGKTIFEPIDLVLLADDSIGPKATKGLIAAGWKIKRIQRILSPFAKKDAYNQWNYSKLRIWQLTMYEKIIFIDSDLLVLKNIQYFFTYPQLSAAPNEDVIFNSGIMVIEPSQCMFEKMMEKTTIVKPYNGGDQGFLNEIFTWWHRLPSKLNYMKSFKFRSSDEKREVPDDVYAVHYLGLKPWMCYRDYDCNWDMEDHHVFASDSAHKIWWKVYDTMPKHLQSYCGLTHDMNRRIVKYRRIAGNANLSDGHWRIQVKDPRKKHLLD